MQKNFRRQGPWEEYWPVTERFSRSIDASENVLLSLRHSQENPAKNIPLYEAAYTILRNETKRNETKRNEIGSDEIKQKE